MRLCFVDALGSCAAPFKLRVQIEASARIHQAGRAAELGPSMFRLIDGAQPFEL